jgi:hypothetical protein
LTHSLRSILFALTHSLRSILFALTHSLRFALRKRGVKSNGHEVTKHDQEPRSDMRRTIFPALLLSILLAGCTNGQTKSSQPLTPKSVEPTGTFINADIFESTGGGFSIAIPTMPLRTLDYGSEKAKAKGVDAGKQFLWQFERTLYTVAYYPPVNSDGNSVSQVYEDMVSGTRKGAIRQNAKILSEKPIKIGEHRGTEFRYVSAEGVQYINRSYLVGDLGYQIVGGYMDETGEKEVLEVLNSFTLLPSSQPAKQPK